MGQSLSLEQVLAVVKALGWVKGTFLVFFVLAHGVIFALYHRNMSGRQAEIDRLASENKEHRERFAALIDKQLHVPRNLLPSRQKSSTARRKKGGR